jgi:hypothetical protein
MKRGMLVVQAVAIATFVMPMSVSAQAFQPTQQFDSATLLVAAPSLDLSPRTYDDWAVAAPLAAPSLDLSPRIHDDWAIVAPSAAPSLDLSLRSHDDWPLAPAE